MNSLFKMLFTREEGESIFNTAFVYLMAAIILCYVLAIELINGVVYIKHSSPIPIGSSASYLSLAIQVLFLIVALVIFIRKAKKNIENN